MESVAFWLLMYLKVESFMTGLISLLRESSGTKWTTHLELATGSNTGKDTEAAGERMFSSIL
jgi:hypothetical protein